MTGRTEVRRRLRSGLAVWVAACAVLALGIGAPARGGAVWPTASGSVEAGILPAIRATFGPSSAESTFGEEVVFRQQVTVDGLVERAEALLEHPGSIGPVVTEIPVPTTGGPTTLEYRLLASEGALLPNTPLAARFRLTGFDGSITTGPLLRVTYEDTRFDWQTKSGDIVRVHWYEGGDAFGRRALAIAEEGMAEAESFLGVTEAESVDFYVYADRDAFYDAMGPGLRENVGGLAESEIRTLFALITPNEIDDAWVGVVIPHELTHLVFDTAADNPYHLWPKWLDEGVATYLSQGYTPSDRQSVESAVEDGSLIPLDGLTGQFPTVRERFFLAYAESVSAVDFLVREHGTEALAGLINSFADGLSDDEAFEAATGQTTGEFNDAWFADLGAELPTAHGPQPAPIGPLPPDWIGSTDPGAAGSPSLTAVPAATPGSGGAGDGNVNGASAAAILAIALAVAAGAIVTGLLIARRRRPRRRTPAAEPQDPSAAPAEKAAGGEATGAEPSAPDRALE